MLEVKRPRKKQQNNGAIPIYRGDGRAVGRVEGGVFRRAMRSSSHMLKRPQAWAADVDALDQAQAAGASQVEIFDRDTGATYRAELAEFHRRGLPVNRGYGPQLALPLAYWQVTGGRVPARPSLDAAASGPVQLGLFEGVRG